jgi:hypothetical protein
VVGVEPNQCDWAGARLKGVRMSRRETALSWVV